MADPIKLPEPTRQRLQQARMAAIQAQVIVEKYDALVLTTLELVGVDPASNPRIDFETGIITPGPTPLKPEIVKDEDAS